MMRILIYSINYYPELIGIGKYNAELAEWLAQQGHQVRVVSTPPHYPDWKVQAGYRSWTYRREIINGVHVTRCPIWVPRTPGGFKRIIFILSYVLSSLPVMIGHVFWRPNWVMVVMPPLFALPNALLTATLSRAGKWVHIQDLEVDMAFGLQLLPRSGFESLIRRFERWLLNRFQQVSTISHQMVTKIREKEVRGEVILLHNWVDTDAIRPDPEEKKEYRVRLRVDKKQKLILYSGNLGKKQGLEDLIRAAALLKEEPDLIFYVVGDGPTKPILESIVRDERLTNVRFMPLVPVEELPALLNSADLHIVLQKRGAADLVLPSKLTGIFAVGGAALVTCEEETELGILLRDHPGIAAQVPPEDPQALAKAIVEHFAAGDSGQVNQIARRYAEEQLSKKEVLSWLEEELCKADK